VLDYLTPRLFTPLGISGMKWETCPRGINTGGWGLSIQTEGLAKFGQFLLQKGKWKGTGSSSLRMDRGSDEVSHPAARRRQAGPSKGAERLAAGLRLPVLALPGHRLPRRRRFRPVHHRLPEQDAVIVMTSENKNMQGQLDLVWKHLLPAFDAKASPAADLSRRRSLKLALPSGQKSSAPRAMKFTLEANDLGLKMAAFDFRDGVCVFKADDHEIVCGFDDWKRCEAVFPGTPPRLISGGMPKKPVPSKIAAGAAWADESTLIMQWRYYETPHSDTVTCEFFSDGVTISFLNSITAMNPKAKDARAPLKGRASA
jgi:hypothetical protein